MRKLRIFVVELVLVGILVAWIFETFPAAVDRFIPWIGMAILWHLTYEIVLDLEWVRTRAKIAYRKMGSMTWIIAFCAGGLISVGYFYSIKTGLTALASAKRQSNQEKALEEHRSDSGLKLRIDRLIPLYGYKHVVFPSGVPVPIPPANAPTDKDLDTNILILGTILNDRDVQADR